MMLDKKETDLLIPGPAGQLQASLSSADETGVFAIKSRLVIICHPHPVHGGTMDNKVVTTLMRTYRDVGIHVLRFNFRGVGKSEGQFDNAIGEFDDLIAIISWVKLHLPACSLLLAGFSFGSSIAARASYSVDSLEHLTLVAPPIERYEYDRNGEFNSPLCVIQGDQDERVMAQGVYDWMTTLKSPAQLIRYPEAGHFFHGCLSALKTDLSRVLLTQLTIS